MPVAASYDKVYGLCENKCKLPVVSREEIETEYFNNKKILFCDKNVTFSIGVNYGEISVDLNEIYKEQGITVTKIPKIFPVCYTSGVCLSVKFRTSATATISFRAVENTINSLSFGIMVIIP